MNLPKVLQNLIEQFSSIPGIGPKSAMRHAMYLSHWSQHELMAFGKSIEQMSELNKCEECGLFCDYNICEICQSNERKEAKSICIVENFNDVLAIENSSIFYGVYHVLGGVLNPLIGIGPEELNIGKLIERVKKLKINNVILAVNPSVEGDATCSFIKGQLGPSVCAERIGLGVPMGGSLEYLDSLTIAKALENRTSL